MAPNERSSCGEPAASSVSACWTKLTDRARENYWPILDTSVQSQRACVFPLTDRNKRAYSPNCSEEASNNQSWDKMGSDPSYAVAVIMSARRVLKRHNGINLGGARRESKART